MTPKSDAQKVATTSPNASQMEPKWLKNDSQNDLLNSIFHKTLFFLDLMPLSSRLLVLRSGDLENGAQK